MMVVPIEVLQNIEDVNSSELLRIYNECKKNIPSYTVGDLNHCMCSGLMYDIAVELTKRGVKYE